MKTKVKFTQDRGNFKKDEVIEVTEEVALQLKATGELGSVVDADQDAVITSGAVVNKRIKAAQAAKARELKKKAKELEDARK